MSIDPSKYNAIPPSKFQQFLESAPPVIYQPLSTTKSMASLADSVANSVATAANANKAFSELGKSAEQIQQAQNASMNDFVDQEPQSEAERAKRFPPENTDGRDKKTGKFSILSVLKIVPIGMNIFRKFPKVMSGLQDMVIGFQKLITNGIITASSLVPNIFVYSGLNFMVGMIHTICMISNIKNLHICSVPYLFDAIVALFRTICCSFVSILDSFIIKRLIGFPLYDLVVQGFDYLGKQIHYPDFIINLCYQCKLTNNNSTYNMLNETKNSTGRAITKIITKDVPPRIMQPIRQEIRGISKIASLFNL